MATQAPGATATWVHDSPRESSLKDAVDPPEILVREQLSEFSNEWNSDWECSADRMPDCGGSERRPKVEVVRDAAAAIAGLFGGEGRTATAAAAQHGIDANVGVASGTGISVGFRRAPPMKNVPRGVFWK